MIDLQHSCLRGYGIHEALKINLKKILSARNPGHCTRKINAVKLSHSLSIRFFGLPFV